MMHFIQNTKMNTIIVIYIYIWRERVCTIIQYNIIYYNIFINIKCYHQYYHANNIILFIYMVL